ncbi:DUF1294 domain-containing protein [Halobacillus seohaensis]|uniref:DUF1294 domain-containing protein n=1 Tax=Halobacillus seohaensis TaxID=447421 RepID=A0ABW2EH60_9BACI
MGIYSYLLIYFILMNFILFLLMGYDKQQARRSSSRISEKNLWTFAIIGGSIGGMVGMKVYRHKTKHISFKMGMPIITIVHLSFLYLFTRF